MALSGNCAQCVQISHGAFSLSNLPQAKYIARPYVKFFDVSFQIVDEIPISQPGSTRIYCSSVLRVTTEAIPFLAASDPKIITSVIGPREIHLYESKEHHGNWLACIRSRKQPIAPIEVAHRSCSTCLIHQIAMKLKRKVYWDPQKERFKHDDQANAMLSRSQRPPYVIPNHRVWDTLAQ